METQVIPHTAPETQKVHIRLAQLEINTGIKNLRDAIGYLAQNKNFRYSKEDKAEMQVFRSERLTTPMRITILVYDIDTDVEIGTEPDEMQVVSSFVKAQEALGRLERNYERRTVAQNNIIPEDES